MEVPVSMPMLCVAILQPDIDTTAVQILIDHKADVNMAIGEDGNALHLMCLDRYHKGERNRMVDDWAVGIGSPGVTALHHAACVGHVEIVQLLLDNKADPEATSKTGQTPLMMATEHLGIVPEEIVDALNVEQ